MHRIGILLTLTLALAAAPLTQAVPAWPGTTMAVQPDGTVIELSLLGDEYGHVTVDAEGQVVRQDSLGYWRSAAVTPRSALESRRSRVRARSREVQRTSFPRTGRVRALVVLVDFPDVPFVTPDVHREFSEMLNLEGFDRREHIGSAADYFRAQSRGLFDPSFDVYGPVRASHDATYYGENDANGDDMRAHELAMEICRKLDDEIDFSEYDLDGDGRIDNVYFFYAGYGENFAGNKASWIWPHAAHIDELGVPESERTYDGKILNSYGCCAELYGSTGRDVAAIGTFCHEFGHILGLPDTYDVNYSVDGSGYHPDAWDIMASGSYLPATRNCGAVPAGYSALERWLLGWETPETIAAAQTVTLAPLQADGRGVRISTANPDEFFLLENRQRTAYDRYLPSHGMLVWHVDRRPDAYINVTLADESKTISCADAWSLDYNAVNANASHQCLEIEKAGGNDGSKSSEDTPYPGRQLRTSITDDTSPSLRSWTGAATGRHVTAIAERDGRITFDFMGGSESRIRAVALPATAVSETGFTANWEACPEAVGGYIVDLYSVARHTDTEARTLDASFASLPDGWTVSGDYSYGSQGVTLGGTQASVLTAPEVDLSGGGLLTITAALAQTTAVECVIRVGETIVDRYIPTAGYSDYSIELPAGLEGRISLSVEGRRGYAVNIREVSLVQEADVVTLTAIPDARAEVTTGLSHVFGGLDAGAEYAYRVSVAGYAGSASEAVYVNTSGTGGVGDISYEDSEDDDSVYYTPDGRRTSAEAPGIYILRRGSKSYKVLK